LDIAALLSAVLQAFKGRTIRLSSPQYALSDTSKRRNGPRIGGRLHRQGLEQPHRRVDRPGYHFARGNNSQLRDEPVPVGEGDEPSSYVAVTDRGAPRAAAA
jgi:hypothetical protein